MSINYFAPKKAFQVFGVNTDGLNEKSLQSSGFPAFAKSLSDNRPLKSWSLNEMTAVGEKIGFMEKPARPIAAAVFVTKGGVLKTSLTMNLARMAALHGIRTCVVGLDMQGDISGVLNSETEDEESTLEDALEKIDSQKGLADLYAGSASLDEIIRSTDIPTLQFIPETPELVALDQSLVNRNRREFWLQDRVIQPLKQKYDLILMDGSPNWNRLITNALVACDVLISPLECKINNFRNFKTFRTLLKEFKGEMQLNFAQVYVPTRLVPTRRLSREIFDWYRANLSECTTLSLRESSQGEESVALRVSIPEYSPTHAAADELRTLLNEIWDKLLECGASVEPRSREIPQDL